MGTRPKPLIPEGQISKPAPRVAQAPTASAGPTRWYKVLDGPRNHSSAPGAIGPFRRPNGDFTLKTGKIINSAQYDIDMLRDAGVKLEEVPAPGWFIRAQKEAQDKVDQLRAEGIDVEDAPEYQAAAVAKSEPASGTAA